MDIEELTGLGFTKNEAKTYLAIIKYGSASANDLIKATKLHKKVVYENIEKLIDKGLVSYVVERKARMFKITSPHMLVESFKEEISNLEKQKGKAIKIAKEISKISQLRREKQEATIYRGTKAIRSFYNDLLKISKDYIVFGAPEKSLKIMGESFWFNYVTKKKYNRMKVRAIFNQSLKDYGERIKDNLTEVKYFDKDFEPLTETNIQEDRIAIIVWSEEPILFLIKDIEVADSYKKYFEKMWRQAKK